MDGGLRVPDPNELAEGVADLLSVERTVSGLSDSNEVWGASEPERLNRYAPIAMQHKATAIRNGDMVTPEPEEAERPCWVGTAPRPRDRFACFFLRFPEPLPIPEPPRDRGSNGLTEPPQSGDLRSNVRRGCGGSQ